MKYAFLILLSLLIGCNSDDDNNSTVSLNQQFDLEIGESASIIDNETQIFVRVNSINDSRCPENAECIWVGNAIVKINIQNEIDSELCIGACHVDSDVQIDDNVTFNVDDVNYKLALKDVLPYNILPEKEQTKSAVIIITRE